MPQQDSRKLPLPEVTEVDSVTGWGLWESAVAFQDQTPPPSFSATEPSVLAPMFQPEKPTISRFQTLTPNENTAEKKRLKAMAVLARDHQRIHDAIEATWGQRECSQYIEKLLMTGSDNRGKNREGFKLEAVTALLALAELNDEASAWQPSRK